MAYVILPGTDRGRRRGDTAYPRIFYKDSSLVWRSASHYIRSETENWVGKGDLKYVVENGRSRSR